MNKVKTRDIYFKIEIWLDFREDHTSKEFTTEEEQTKCLTDLKTRFVHTINQSYVDSKGEDMITKVAEVGELKFENHHSESSSPNGRSKNRGSGGYNSGGGGGSRRW